MRSTLGPIPILSSARPACNNPTPFIRTNRNLNNGKWSGNVKAPGKGWRLAAHVDRLELAHVRPICSVKGAERIRARGAREVVARIEGVLLESSTPVRPDAKPVRYNPFRCDYFTNPDGSIFEAAGLAIFPADSPCFYVVD